MDDRDQSVDVLAAQVRGGITKGLHRQPALLALDALVARAAQAEERHEAAMAQFDRATALEAEREALVARVTEAEREVEAQMQAKLDAQRTLVVVTKALALRLADLGNGWLEAAPKIVARIETIVDEGNRGFTERDAAQAALADARNALERIANETDEFDISGELAREVLGRLDGNQP